MNREQLEALFKTLVIIALLLFKGFCIYTGYQMLTNSHPIWALVLFYVAFSSVNISYGKGE